MASFPALIFPSSPWTARLICASLAVVSFFFVTVERDPLHRVLTGVLDEVTGLHKHPTGAAGGVKNDAVVGLDDVDDGLNDGGRRKELAVVVRALLGELREEVFVDATEDIARCMAQGFRVEGAHHAFEKVVLEAFVIFGKLTGKRLEAVLDTSIALVRAAPML
jgi:hypothetical protein